MSRGGRKTRKKVKRIMEKIESIRRMSRPDFLARVLPPTKDNVEKMMMLDKLVKSGKLSVNKAVEKFYE